MLVLGRKVGETILIGDDIAVTVTEVTSGTVHLAITAPRDVKIVREELVGRSRKVVDVSTDTELHMPLSVEDGGQALRRKHGKVLGSDDNGSGVSTPRQR